MNIIEIIKNNLNINLKNYENINIDINISIVILCIFIGITLVSIVYNHYNYCMITLTKRLIRYSATDIDNAKTLDEINLNIFGVRFLLNNSSRISKLIERVGEVKLSYDEYEEKLKTKNFKEEKIDFATARFFISYDKIPEARLLSEKPTPGVVSSILFCILMIFLFIFVILTLPELLTLINNTI